MNEQTQDMQAFVNAYNALCIEYGHEIQAVDQRKIIDGVWVVSSPQLAVVPMNKGSTETGE